MCRSHVPTTLHTGARTPGATLASGRHSQDDDTQQNKQEQQQCFEQACQDSPFIMHASRTANSSSADPPGAVVMSCFQFVAIGCYAAPKGCCPEVARRFTGLEFDISE
jgi:hypothetical protein